MDALAYRDTFTIRREAQGLRSEFVVSDGAGEARFGGNYAVTCDSRWKFGALPIHDRTETPEQTAFLSV